ncbi:tRNA-uridine aminocarboxypropyltransferase [Comamonas sp. GB3 AK4-5]|uniref:tRNA-uridine aminocarboxypropyltransferase n=1 Tax=Comamonas sp. GB3 AK4-5 TaxID=3231487 RepID=UPI00351E8445
MRNPIPGRRAHCPQCLRPSTACICHCVQPVEHRTQVLLLQHPMEAMHPKGTARLLHLCLPHSRMEVAEVWPEAELQALLHGRWSAALPAPALTLLLYPPSPPDPSLPLQPPPAWEMADLARLPEGSPLRLVVLDGTWRKSRKMLYLNPALQQLPRLPLRDLPEGSYTIRKAHLPGQLSTLEASWAALHQLEPSQPALNGLLQAMATLQQQYRHWASGDKNSPQDQLVKFS